MRAALAVRDVHIYPSPGAVQDFLLFPRTSPHFAGAYDPSAILIVSDSEVVDARVTQAFEFPPPAFFPPATSSNVTKVPDPQDTTDEAGLHAQLEEELQSTLQSMSLTTDPRPVRLPPSLWSVLGESLVKLEKDAYEVFIREKDCDIEGEEALPIKGGVAWIEDTEGQMKLMKLQPHRVLITHHPDLSLRFLDLSAQLLPSPNADHRARPITHRPLTRPFQPTYTSDPGSSTQIKERVEAVHFAPESLECVVVLRSGAVVLFRLDMLSSGIAYGTQEMQDEELVSLAHTCVRDGVRFCPVFGVKPHQKRGPVSACAISDIGFLAIAYQSGALLLVDLRGPHVILRSDVNASGERSSFLHRHSQSEPIVSLTWTVCRLSTDQTPHIRLFAIAPSGLTSIYTIVHAPPSSWTVSKPALAIESVPRPLPCASFVLDAKTGVQCRANRRGLSAVLKAAEGQVFDDDGRESLGTKGTVWVSAGAKGARCTANVNGERIARVEWGSKVGTVQHVEVVEKNGSCVLVVFTDQGVALVYSLPLLEHMHSLQLPPSRSSDPPSTDNTGDYVTHVPFPSASGSAPRLLLHTDLQTLFALRRTAPYAPPTVDLSSARGTVPAQPQPVSLAPASMLGSLLGYIGGLAGGTGGEQVDALLAGPDRPAVPQSGTTAGRPRQLSPKDASGRLSPSSVEQASVASTSASVTSGVSDLYNRLGTALAERGQMLGDLQESFDSLEQGSKNMLSQAKNMATQQSVKRCTWCISSGRGSALRSLSVNQVRDALEFDRSACMAMEVA
ncbi:Lethal(2) giant larvae SRO7 [Grifola frondosa]|uniref:Lethal(2) giant larvae SRO7 n=1 Tax=Grifola frondosa TaxID=5627 RepID=A0A1C7MQS8_GRIFR|nr:Lethal(2) giant larvae SRO7 [Grifola frondosa]